MVSETLFTFEEDNGVVGALWMRTFHCSIQMVRDSREDFRDILGIAILQLVLVKAEHLVVLCLKYTSKIKLTSR